MLQDWQPVSCWGISPCLRACALHQHQTTLFLQMVTFRGSWYNISAEWKWEYMPSAGTTLSLQRSDMSHASVVKLTTWPWYLNMA
jgi:hypothetical protein